MVSRADASASSSVGGPDWVAGGLGLLVAVGRLVPVVMAVVRDWSFVRRVGRGSVGDGRRVGGVVVLEGMLMVMSLLIEVWKIGWMEERIYGWKILANGCCLWVKLEGKLRYKCTQYY